MSAFGRIGLVAVHKEMRPLLDMLQGQVRERQGDAILHQGQLGSRRVVLAEVLPGPVNAALGAQALIAHHGVGSLIGFGSAGALDPRLLPGDLVVARQAVAHDAGVFLGKRFEPGGVMGRHVQGRVGHRRAFTADPDLVARALEAAQILGRRAYTGTVVTGNQAIFSTARRRWLRQTFEALAVEMETAAVAQVAVAYQLPWVAVRVISDMASDDLILEYNRLRIYLDDGQPAWRQRAGRWVYLLTHPVAWRRLRGLRSGLAMASGQAAQVVGTMLQT